ncbi:hypothetical protein Hanom_Chr16g01507901 [Helianthus anomalus]
MTAVTAVVAGVMAAEEAVAAVVVVVIIAVDGTEIIRNNTVINSRNSIRKVMEAVEVEAGVENPVGSEVVAAVVSKVNRLRLTLGRMLIECRKSTRGVVLRLVHRLWPKHKLELRTGMIVRFKKSVQNYQLLVLQTTQKMM